ncbi:MAG: sigma-70 family RNA polymerase sigma factor [Dehalococcoidia bacterium]|nr:sigma-70 family RNA polymerase sigma factor [Dehalococcoidia bacterium]MDH4291652.1 sigma-70 family RNA polymerase sigma factor [Dehalococcoidia bacterium]
MNRNRSEEPTSDEATLVQRAIGHDPEAFGRLYDMHVDRVYRHIYYRVGNETDAEDLTQQVFLKAWQAIHRYKKTASPFIAWLMTISHNVIVDFYRTKKDKAYLEAEVLASDPASSPEGAAETSFEQQRLRRAILQLGSDEQQVVILRFIEGFEFSEIASLLKKKEGNVRVILHRALVKLRNILEKDEEQRSL